MNLDEIFDPALCPSGCKIVLMKLSWKEKLSKVEKLIYLLFKPRFYDIRLDSSSPDSLSRASSRSSLNTFTLVSKELDKLQKVKRKSLEITLTIIII